MSGKFRLFFSLLVLCAAVFFSAHAHALSINNVRFGDHPDKTRMVLEVSDISDFRVFMLDNPYRIVVDMPSFDWRAHNWKTDSGLTDTTPVQTIRYGDLKTNISRMVVDLKQAAVIQSAFFLPKHGDRPNRLVIDFQKSDAMTFNAEKEKVLGTLDINQNTTSPENYKVASLVTTPPPTPSTKKSKPLVIIDPGHGGVDPGAIGTNGVREKDITLSLSQKLKKMLESKGYNVKMTRTNDTFIRLQDRVAFAHEQKGDIFVSIHADSIRKNNVSGASVYTLSETASDAQTAKLAQRENQADLIAGINLASEEKDVANILIDLAMRETMNQSKFFANTLVETMKSKRINMLDNPHRYAGFAVLKAPDIPSILVESGFISNAQEARLLSTSAHQSKIANSIASGIDAYFARVDHNNRI